MLTKHSRTRRRALQNAKAAAAAHAARTLLLGDSGADTDTAATTITAATAVATTSHDDRRRDPRVLLAENAELHARLLRRDQQVRLLSKEVELLRTGISVLREDLSVKREQFEFLFTSLRAASDFARQDPSAVAAEAEATRRLEFLERTLADSTTATAAPTTATAAVAAAAVAAAAATVAATTGAPAIKSETKTETNFGTLPPDARNHLNLFLNFGDHARCIQVSREWRAAHTASESWFLEFRRCWDPDSRDRCVSSTMDRAPAHRSGARTWKRAFALTAMHERRWAANRPQVSTVVGHRGTVTCLGMLPQPANHGLDHRRLISGSDDGSLRMWVLSGGGDGISPTPMSMGGDAKFSADEAEETAGRGAAGAAAAPESRPVPTISAHS